MGASHPHVCLNRTLSQPVWPQMEAQSVSFSIHEFTQNSVKAAKAVNTANRRSPGSRSCPISFFINQSTLQDLDGEQCHWSGMPSISLLDANAIGAFVHAHTCRAAAAKLQERGIDRGCGVMTCELM